MLLQKYIVNGSEFEINISYKLKKKLLSDLEDIDNLNETKLIHLFDETIQTLLWLLNDSFIRFVKTEKYKQIEKELASDTIDMVDDINMDIPSNNNNDNNDNKNKKNWKW